jgi:hypothetical protein
VPVTRADMLEGLLIAAVVFVVVLVLALLFVIVSMRVQQGDANVQPSAMSAALSPLTDRTP